MTRRVRLMLEYFHPWPNAVGMYLARESGYYRAAGIDVSISTIDPGRGDTLDHLMSGDADIGVFPTNRFLTRVAAGQELAAIAALNHRPLEAIQTVAETGISRPADLSGRRVALNPTARGVAMVRHLVEIDGGDPDSVEFVDSGFRELHSHDIAAGMADATFGGYWCWDALLGVHAADRHVVWPIDTLGAPVYEPYLLGGRRDGVLGDDDLVSAFLGATASGYELARDDPQAARAVLEQVIPYFPSDVLSRSLSLVTPTWFASGVFGTISGPLMTSYAQWLARVGIPVGAQIDPAALHPRAVVLS